MDKMNASVNDEGEQSFERVLTGLLAQHGRMRVLWAVLWQGRSGRADSGSVTNLNAHLRRDIGLPPGDWNDGW
ncbi:MAG: hypothetical protein ACRC6I_22030 [Paracoccaceae bacterium]